MPGRCGDCEGWVALVCEGDVVMVKVGKFLYVRDMW